MTEQQALLEAIRERPEDDTPRLAYADWLDEHGKADRAEFIRVSIEYSRLLIGATTEEETARIHNLHEKHAYRWRKEVAATLPKNRLTTFCLRRGIFTEMWCTPKYFRDAGEQVVSALPITSIWFQRPTPKPLALALRSPAFRKITTLLLDADQVGTDVIRTVLAAPVDHLRTLSITSNFDQSNLPNAGAWSRRSQDWVQLIARSTQLRGLRQLNLSLAGIGEFGAYALAATRELTSLRLLLLIGNRLDEAVKQRLRTRFSPNVYFDYPEYRSQLTHADLE